MKSMRRHGGLPTSLAIIGLVAVLGIGTGCDQESGGVGSFDDTAVAAGAETLDESLPAGPFATLTVEEIDARVNLTAEQKTAIQSALNRARAVHDQRVDGRGRGAWGRRGTADRPRFGPAAGDPPTLVFLEDASKTLTPEQFTQLARLLKEERDAWIAARPALCTPDGQGQRGRGRGKGEGRGMGAGRGPGAGFELLADRAAGYLDLTDAQREQIRSIIEERAAEMREARSQIATGSATPEAARDAMRALRTGTRDQIKSVLTAEQWEKADAFRSKRMAEQIDARMERMDDQLERRGLFLERVLDLSPAQATQVQGVLAQTIPVRQEVMTSVRAGTLAPEDAAMRILEVEKAAAEQIGGILTPEQTARWEAVKDLLPRGGPGRGF